MSRFRVYIKPFLSSGEYSSVYTEVTDDVDFRGIGSIKETIDSSDFEVGVFKFNRFSVTLNNLEGKYSDVGESNTIFAYKRSGSKVKITWQSEDDICQVGFAICGFCTISEEIEVFKGLLNDESLTSDVKDQKLAFQVLGQESIFDSIETPYTSISNGDTVDAIIYTILNQSAITNLLTVDSGNISTDNNLQIDDKSDLENTTVKEALDELLSLSNSVLYINNDVIYVKDFTPSASVDKTFYGQASENGIEDIISISNIRSGLNKVFNFWTWENTSLVQSDSSSTNQFGIRKKEISISYITDTTKRNTTLSALLAEYKDPKQVLEIEIKINYDNLALFILDRIAIDYPTVYRAADPSRGLPIYSKAIYGTDKYPLGDFAFTITTSTNYKVMERQINIKNQKIRLKLRAI
jgi:hypothetical protein